MEKSFSENWKCMDRKEKCKTVGYILWVAVPVIAVLVIGIMQILPL